MTNQIEIAFASTGDPWIDAGIVGFFDELLLWSSIPMQDIVRVDNDNFSIAAHTIQDIEIFLNKAFEQMKSRNYVAPTGNKVLIFNKDKSDFEIVDKINLVSIVGVLLGGSGDLKPEYEKCDFPEHLRDRFDELRKSNKKDKVEAKEKKIRCSPPSFKNKWAYSATLSVAQQKGNNNKCAFCGRDGADTNIHSNNYPFMVPAKNWSNFFSNQSLELKMCSVCEISSLFAATRIFYNWNQINKTFFIAIPHDSNLEGIRDFWDSIKGCIELKTLRDNSNIFSDGYKYKYLNETILAFSYQLYDSFKKAKRADELLQKASLKNWHFFLGVKGGQLLSFKNYGRLDELHRLFNLFSELEKNELNFYQIFSNLAIKTGKNWNNLYRESLSQGIIRNTSINEAAESFIWKKNIDNFAEFIKLYNKLRR